MNAVIVKLSETETRRSPRVAHPLEHTVINAVKEARRVRQAKEKADIEKKVMSGRFNQIKGLGKLRAR